MPAGCRLRAVREVMQIEHPREHADHVRVLAQDRSDRRTGIGRARGDAEDAIRLVVDERQPAVARDRQHAVAHAGHDVAEERVIDPRLDAPR